MGFVGKADDALDESSSMVSGMSAYIAGSTTATASVAASTGLVSTIGGRKPHRKRRQMVNSMLLVECVLHCALGLLNTILTQHAAVAIAEGRAHPAGSAA